MSNVFENIRNGKKVILVSENSDAVLVKFMDSGEEKMLSPKTLKRWYKPCEDDYEPAEVPAEEPVVEIKEAVEAPAEEPIVEEPVVETSVKEPVAEEPKEETPAPVEVKKPVKKVKKAKEPTVDYSAIHSHLLDLMNKKVESVPGLSLFHSEKVSGFYSMKLDGKMVMNFTLSKKRGVVLWLRSAAVHGMATFEKFAHTFDARLAIAEWNPDNYKLISELFNASLAYQAEKNAKSASKKSKKSKKAE